MAAPEFVPVPPVTTFNAPYVSSPWSFDPWEADRPAELPEGQPRAARFGYPGPDQGFALKLVRHFEDQLVLADREQSADACSGGVAVALKRASFFGRAPVIHDLRVAFTVWGYLAAAPSDLVDVRRPLFEEVANPHHYAERRRIADLVPDDTLRLGPAQVAERHQADWKGLLDLSLLDTQHPH